MNDYGTLRKESQFDVLFPDFAKRQEKVAEEIWSRILGRCGVDIGMPAISRIIDVGCFEGTLTAQLAKKLSSVGDGTPRSADIQTIGIDYSKEAIAMALKLHADVPCCKFLHWAGGFSDLFAKLQNEHQVIWNQAALICLSHTWFHLDQDDILAAIRRFRPAVLLIDVFHTWDNAIDQLAKGATHITEFGRLHQDCTYWLRTIADPTDAKKVKRGIWRCPPKQAQDAASVTEGEWLFETTQHALSTAAIFGQSINEEDPNIFSKSRELGLITGETIGPNGCDYIQRKLIRHSSAWGEMLCHVLAARAPEAPGVNDAYFRVVRLMVRRLFVENDEKSFSSVRELLRLYDEDAAWLIKNGVSGSREALIVLPFDTHTNFARVVSLFPNAPDTEISKHDLIVESPKEIQVRFPTAYGVFHTFEDKVSSPQGFPLHWAQDYEHAPVDKAFGKLESALLRDNTFFAPSYFLLPVYFGSLPLFALALKFPTVFDPQSTDFQVYLATLTNLHGEIKTALTDEFIERGLLRPWTAAALDVLAQNPESNGDQPPCLERRLDMLEQMLFGDQFAETPKKNMTRDLIVRDCPGVFWIADVARVGGVLGKDWKSWILTIPSFPIKRLRSVEAENRRLWNMWHKERENILRDDELRLSYWFEQGDFFANGEKGGHDEWLNEVHLPRLHHMFEIAGLTSTSMGSTADATWLSSAMAALEALVPISEKHSATSDGVYFGYSKRHFLFTWMVRQLRSLVNNHDDFFGDDRHNI